MLEFILGYGVGLTIGMLIPHIVEHFRYKRTEKELKLLHSELDNYEKGYLDGLSDKETMTHKIQ